VTSETSGYAPNTDWEFGNNFLAYYLGEGQVGAWDITQEINRTAVLPMAGPWNFDPTPVEAEVAALSTVDERFGGLLNWGLVDPDDPDAGIDAYIQARNDAGLDVIFEEMQRQLDEFVANNPEIFGD
jgi:putative aldouronate transport system substrate-binding protein